MYWYHLRDIAQWAGLADDYDMFNGDPVRNINPSPSTGV